MLSSLKVQDEKREEGFTLIELLVVVIIIGILAAIAIPVFLNQRESAWRSAAESDARNAAIGIETYLTSQRDLPPDADFAWAEGEFGGIYWIAADDETWTTGSAPGTGSLTEVTVTRDVTLVYVVDGNSYTITASHDRLDGEEIVYNSATGGLASSWSEVEGG